MVADARTGRFSDIPAYWTYIPRRDQPERYDEQESFYYDKVPGVAFMCGGNGCLAPHYPIYNPLTGQCNPIASITGRHHVLAMNPHTGNLEPALAEAPYRKGEAPILSITLSSGEKVFCTSEHRLLNSHGTWVQAGQLRVGDALLLASKSYAETQSHSQRPAYSEASKQQNEQLALQWSCNSAPRPTTSASFRLATPCVMCDQCGQRGMRIVPDSPVGCPSLCCSCDAQPHLLSGIGLDAPPLLADALERTLSGLLPDDLVYERGCTRAHGLLCQHDQSAAVVHNGWSTLTLSDALRPVCDKLATQMRSDGGFSPACTSLLLDQLRFASSHPCFESKVPHLYGTYVTRIEMGATQDFYDFGVPGYGNYYAGGLIHANSGTTTTAIAKAIKFILETPAPRRDTPFWFIAESYEQVCNLYDEKLSNLGHLPEHLIEHNRIFWKNRNNNWPMRVPLISHQGRRGKNWVLEFKSWKQGRGQMQARSIGGFLFMEQFPWKVFEEVVRGCREYNFPGAKLVEYTPVDPDLSLEIEEMLENGYEPDNPKERQKGARYLPKDWKVYHANTACAMEQGHVDKAWFEEFFGMIPEDMLDVRMKGLFASFEGTIYKEFDVKTHCVGDEAWKHLQDAHWIRGIDWGGGPENAFAALLVGITGDGVAYVMDEYYSFNQDCTTIDHLVNIQEQMPWPIENPNYGMTYADPADPDNFRIASKLSQYAKSHRGVDIQNMPMARAKNAVFEGIEHIRMMLKPSRVKMVFNKDTNMLEEKKIPRLYIHKGNCPNLIRELKTYRWQKSSDPSGKGIINPRAAKRAPAKFNDHACFTPDTLVQVGWKTIKPICEVEAGGTVEGRDKRSRVLAGWTVTRRDVEILELRFKDSDDVIRCTPDHRLWYWGQWVRAECLKDDTDIFSSWTSYVVPEVGCIATQSGNFKLACGIVAKNCDALRYALATHYQSMGMTIESARLSKPRTGAPESLRDSGKRYNAVTEMHRVD